MLSTVVPWIIQYKYILIFYLVIIALLFIKRKQIEVQGKIIFLYRMKWGLKWMDKVSQKYREWIILLGYIGVGAGFVGLVVISYVLIKNLIDLIANPATPSGVSLVLPGINVPGLGILPFWYWLIAIFIIALVHEFAHGVVARAHNIEVKNTGIVLFGPIIGAFVEPNEKKMAKDKDIVQYSILAAGAFTNVILAVLSILLLTFAFAPAQQAMVEPTGFTFDAYVNEQLPFAQAGIASGTLITGINGVTTTDFQQFSSELASIKPGETITVQTADKDYALQVAANPDDQKKPFLGIQSIRNEFEIKPEYSIGIWSVIYYVVDWIAGFLRWLFLLSFGIGLFNLLPLPIVDGGRMAQTFLHKLKGPEIGERRYRQVGLFFLLILLLNLFFPLILKLF
ncbi:site-2 protease family protein [Candidatus Woesearchaeota archaeon]|nr:site-2 protease family protein [Candidatus Woesearchaeota archaeon]